MQPGSEFEQSLAGLWAKKYIRNLTSSTEDYLMAKISGRAQTAEKLLSRLRFCSSRAWAKTDGLLFQEIEKHRINTNLIDPWKIAEDSRQLFEKAIESYQAKVTPERFSVIISKQCGKIRQDYTTQDPRILGFVSMQFHYTGRFLLEELNSVERGIVADYLKVMDDHLYMPLHRSYEAAAKHSLDSPALQAVQHLLPLSTQIAEFICMEVAESNPEHRCSTGSLSNPTVRTSSIRDAEMFQTYLCLCALERSIAPVQQELFPLCVMLYPPLQVNWNLVRQLVSLLERELQKRLKPEHYTIFVPFLGAFQDMFSEDIFPASDPIWDHHPDAIRFVNLAKNILQEAVINQETV
ncbi:MAG TPA: hypothetical protein V6C78_04590 [Crinalium sp.]